MKLINDDCFVAMKEISDKAVDMILCDLPYGTTRNKWDKPLDIQALWKEYKRIIKDNGVIALFSQIPFTIDICNGGGYDILKYEYIWVKDNSTGFLNANKMPMKRHENILIFYKSLPVYNPQFERRGFNERKSITTGGQSSNYDGYKKVPVSHVENGYPIDIIQCKRDKEKIHPTQKPVNLCRYLIRTYTNQGDLVLDNCMGSGTTGVACVEECRDFIGIEKDAEYFKIAQERILRRLKND